ncbi:hypothetical protein O181_057103 [Austropuccinia psidii MF-1]|uniref:Uncharacterized protein n=1 Tax=Austropuccinia psidii MF-1 TaxID=1389203 RepID=A0A9Q3HU54_9BASI|nr:hypothetical protein [Austropuccinia psidii MF-1]
MIKNWLKKQSCLSIDQKKGLEMNPALGKEGPVVSTSSRSIQGQVQRTSEEAERSQEQSKQRKRQSHRLPKFEPLAVDSVFNMARTLMKFTAKEQERMKSTFPRKKWMKLDIINLLWM